MKEIWKNINGYEGLYQISNLGRVKSMKRRGSSGGLIKIQTRPDGYKTIILYKNSKGKTCRVHRLVCKAFIKNNENKPHINHKDGNKSNNILTNLEWVTRSENELHAHKIGLKNHKGENHQRSKLTEKDVLEIREMLKTKTQREIANIYSVDHSTIGGIKRKKIWKHI